MQGRSSFPTTAPNARRRRSAPPLGVDFISRARKPFSRARMHSAAESGSALPLAQTAVVGDQIYTDVFGGNRAGALTCYVADA